jgi:aspartyl-tRNA(Asn)/glutamyl-tRNA(Gln) amidotransferase subunit A
MTSQLLYMSIDAVAGLIRKRELSPVEITLACLERIDELDSKLHAFITLTREFALESALQAEKEICNGHYRGALHGIPIAHKDIIWTKGIRTTAHSKFLKDWIPTESATVFERLNQAGAICLGKTALHEFAYGSPGADEAFPAARNPWNLNYAPGSSSSGSGAAVAAGLCMGATGTDTGGSIRHPASVCAVVGMKPTFGRVSVYGVIPLAPSLDHVGPMTRTVRDNAIMLQIMAGHDTRDKYSANHAIPDFQGLIGKDIRGIRIGIPRRFLESVPHEKEVLEAFAKTERSFQELGAKLFEIDVPGLERASDDAGLIMAYEAYQYHKNNLATNPTLFGSTFKERVSKGAQYTEDDYQSALDRGKKLQDAYNVIYCSGIQVIISPGREGPADSMAQLLADPTKRGVTNRMYNLTGAPALTMPMGFSALGLPLGLQISGPHFSEEMIYQVAAAYGEVSGWLDRHPLP